jgi:3-oxoadipate enol-lactonase
METMQTRESFIDLVKAVLDLRPLVDRLMPPVNFVSTANRNTTADPQGRNGNFLELEAFLNRVANRIESPAFQLCTEMHSVLDLAVSRRLFSEQIAFDFRASLEPDEENEIIKEAIARSFDAEFFRGKVESFDGASLRVYSSGDRKEKVAILVSPCGMPAKLCEPWIRSLAKDHFVVTWETRLLFEELVNPDSFAFDVNAQVRDLFLVMDYFDIRQAHLMGLCGGAVIALSAAATEPQRISSLSLWHGDFELGPGCPRTKHQKDLKAFMSAAAMGRRQAEQLQKMFVQNTIKGFRGDWAHVVLYPYANAELLYHYARSNGNIMATNVSPLLSQVAQPTLVVTSKDDSTTHPDGSKRVAESLPNAQLEVLPHGDHLSLFYASPEVTTLAASFLADAKCSAV